MPKDGTIVRIAGTGKKGASGLESAPLQAELTQPHGVAEAADGTIFIADSLNNRLLKIVK
jgi:serine/threonine-protein kinase